MGADGRTDNQLLPNKQTNAKLHHQSAGLEIDRSRVQISPTAMSSTTLDQGVSVTKQYNLVRGAKGR